jgi:hypothetical protein
VVPTVPTVAAVIVAGVVVRAVVVTVTVAAVIVARVVVRAVVVTVTVAAMVVAGVVVRAVVVAVTMSRAARLRGVVPPVVGEGRRRLPGDEGGRDETRQSQGPGGDQLVHRRLLVSVSATRTTIQLAREVTMSRR